MSPVNRNGAGLTSCPLRNSQWMLSLSKIASVLSSATSRNRRAESKAALPGRPCPFYATKFHAATKDMIADERMWNGHDQSYSLPWPFTVNNLPQFHSFSTPLITHLPAVLKLQIIRQAHLNSTQSID